MSRKTLRASRTEENFTQSGLKTITGQTSTKDWGKYTAKELIDNALEASDDVSIDVDIETDHFDPRNLCVEKISVSDDGPGIDEDTIHDIFGDLDHFVGTKRHYQIPTRGNQGNALMSVLGIQYVINPDRPLIVHSRGKEYTIRVTKRGSKYESTITHTDSSDVSGFGVTVEFGDNRSIGAGRTTTVVEELAVFNPQTEFTLTVDGETTTFPAIPDSTVTSATNKELATWFSFSEFYSRYVAEEEADPDMTLQEFVSQFYGLKTKADDIVTDNDDVVINGNAQGIAVDGGTTSEEDILRRIYERACEETNDRSVNGLDNTIGSIGEDLKRRLQSYTGGEPEDIINRIDKDGYDDADDITVYYDTGGEYTDSNKTIPFWFEMAAVPTEIKESDDAPYTDLLFGVNQSVLYKTPNITLDTDETGGRRKIESIFTSIGHEFTVVANLYCPNIGFGDKGKQDFNHEPFEETVSQLVGKAKRKIERDIRPRLNNLRDDEPDPELDNKAPNGFIKDFVYDNFWNVYNEATDEGRYSIEMRQFFYNMRPLFNEETDRQGYKYSTQASVTDPKELELTLQRFRDVVTEFEEERLDERIIERSDRGFFVEPHTNKRVNLGTTAVDAYDASDVQYGDILFVEKTGFMDNLHREFELTKKYDIGLINSKGWNTTAGRNMIEKIQAANPDATMYVLSDFDIAGAGIAANAGETDAFSELDSLDTEQIGVTYDDVQEYDLPAERAGYDESTFTELDNRHEDGVIGDDAYEYLADDQRVEINAFSPVELKDYLETKFEEHGIEKVHPDSEDVNEPSLPDPDEVRTDAIDAAVGNWVINQFEEDDVYEYLRDAVTVDADGEIDGDLHDLDVTADDIHDDITEELKDNPPKHWSDINEEIVEDREDDAEEIEEEYKEALSGATKDYLNENHEVTFE